MSHQGLPGDLAHVRVGMRSSPRPAPQLLGLGAHLSRQAGLVGFLVGLHTVWPPCPGEVVTALWLHRLHLPFKPGILCDREFEKGLGFAVPCL